MSRQESSISTTPPALARESPYVVAVGQALALEGCPVGRRPGDYQVKLAAVALRRPEHRQGSLPEILARLDCCPSERKPGQAS